MWSGQVENNIITESCLSESGPVIKIQTVYTIPQERSHGGNNNTRLQTMISLSHVSLISTWPYIYLYVYGAIQQLFPQGCQIET